MSSEIHFKQITLSDKNTIQQYLKQDSFMISDISFGNLFIWRHSRLIEWAILHDCLIIQTTYEGENPFVFFPIGAGDKLSALKKLKNYYDSKGIPFCFHSLEKHNLVMLESIFGTLDSKLNRDRSDYIYLTQNLITLAGRKYHKKKNHLNRFFEEYAGFSFEEIGASNLANLRTTWGVWSADIESSDVGRLNESVGINDVFENYDALGFRGGLLRFEGKIIAFSFGEIVSDELCVIHIEKADINYRGAYQAINQQLLKHCFSEVKYVNREEDLGIEGLRKAKLSYNPNIILEKYEAVILK